MTDSGNSNDLVNCLGVSGSFGPTVLTQGCLGGFCFHSIPIGEGVGAAQPSKQNLSYLRDFI